MSTPTRVLNLHEEAALQELEALGSKYGYRVHSKMRVADVLPIEGSGISKELFSFALKSHFDFVVCDKAHVPLFTVEFDGPTHLDPRQERRDAKKDEICRIFSFPMLRIKFNHLLKRYNNASLLRWIISAWELQKDFVRGQEEGTVPDTEDFDPMWLFHPGNTIEEIHPHVIALRARLQMERLRKKGAVKYAFPFSFVGTDEADNYRGIEYIMIDENTAVCVESAMRRQNFPVEMGQLFGELLAILLFDKLSNYLETGDGAIPVAEVKEKVASYKARYRSAWSFGLADAESP
jgi:hypothetical protein